MPPDHVNLTPIISYNHIDICLYFAYFYHSLVIFTNLRQISVVAVVGHGRGVHRRQRRHGAVEHAVADDGGGAVEVAADPQRTALRRRPGHVGRPYQHRHPRHRLRPKRAAPRRRPVQRHRRQLGRPQRRRPRPRRQHHRHRRRLRGLDRSPQRRPLARARATLHPLRARGRQPRRRHQGLHAALLLLDPRLLPAVAGLLQPHPRAGLRAHAQVSPVHRFLSHAQRLPLLRLPAIKRHHPIGLRSFPPASTEQGGGRCQHPSPLHQCLRCSRRRRLLRHGLPQRHQFAGRRHGVRVAAQG